MEEAVKASALFAKYAEVVDRESAREKLVAKLEKGAGKAAKEPHQEEADRLSRRKRAEKDEGGIVRDVVESGAFKDFMRTAAREIARGMFRSGRR
jgi:hypothetical protein